MKITLASVLLLFFLFSTKSCLATRATRLGFPPLILPPIYDRDGDEVRPGVPYFMVSTFRGAAGGELDLGWSKNQRCPRFVMETGSDLERGRPVVLTTRFPGASNISVLADVNITFVPGFDPICRASTRWTVDDYDPSTGKGWIKTGGSRFGGLRSWFTVSPVDSTRNTYSINACYPISDDGVIFTCSAVNSFFKDRFRRMGFQERNSGYWVFRFVKAPAIQQVGGNEAN